MSTAAIDISSYQGHPTSADWLAARDLGIEHCWVKVGGDWQANGRPYLNPFAQAQTLGAIQAGLTVAPYLWLDTRWPDQAAVMHELLAEADRIGLAGVPALDAEADAGKLGGWGPIGVAAHAAISALDAERGASALYVDVSWHDGLAAYGAPWGAFTWLADPSHPDTPSRPCDAHQIGYRQLPAFGGYVDSDRIYNPAITGQEDPMSKLSEQQTTQLVGMNAGLVATDMFLRRLHRYPEQPAHDALAYEIATSGKDLVQIEAEWVGTAKANGETIYP